jgi:energy-coupling factor transporter ATP-binding protein EcfA2
MPLCTRIYNTANFKALFEEFTDEELQRLSQEPDLKPVYERLPPNSDKPKIVELLLKHAIETFLTSAKKYNPDKYKKHQPYYKITTLESKREKKKKKKPPRDFILLNALSAHFTSKGYSFPKNLLATFITALQTKGFVILSGLSGTGKTKLAQHLAKLLPKPRETLETVEETVKQGFINITVQPSMIKRSLFVIPKPFWHLIDVPPEGKVSYITLSFEGQSQECRFAHHSYATGDYLLLSLKGKAREWFNNNFAVGDNLIFYPQSNSDNEFTGFELAKPQSIPVQKRRYLPNYTFIAVRPDWRDNKSLLGYYNPLTGIYDDTLFLRFLLQAKAHYDIARSRALPHFVILDEMNLARVEYYFADFLSVLESGRDNEGYSGEAIQLHSQDPEQTFGSRGLTIPQTIKLPPNLYIIGTVNMDETTHAFSPKVLDRAFTIEFNEVDFRNYPPVNENTFNETQKEQLQQVLLVGFQRQGKFAQIDKSQIADAVQSDDQGYRNYLQTLNQTLFDYDLHFGYRVFDEIAQFMAIANEGQLFDNLDAAFDVAVLMKVLPKFNGPRNRLRQPLAEVVAWAKNPNTPQLEEIANELKDAAVCRKLLAQLPGEFAYPETARKAIRMLIRLHETGFASASERSARRAASSYRPCRWR